MLTFLVIVAIVAIGNANCAQTASMIRSSSFVTSLQVRKNAEESYGRCAGTIISKDWIVTAASCISRPDDLKSYYILAGTDDRTRGGSNHEVSKIVIHENFAKTETNEFVNDIALIKVTKPFVFDATRREAKLSDRRLIPAKATPVPISGWGTSKNSGNVPKVLHILSEKMISLDSCQQFYKKPIPDKQFCTSHTENEFFTRNESGNPIVLNGYLIGIGTWSSGRMIPGSPDVFTDVFQYNNWIKSKIAS